MIWTTNAPSLACSPAQLRATVDAGLCHGVSGLAHLASRTADDASPATAAELRAVLPCLLATLIPPGAAPEEATTALVSDPAGPGLLDGAAGIALAALSTAGAKPRTSWDACLLIA
ncbi:lanthionine synthetase LanC family protein [Streptomyces rishiriensis]|uniref:Uncharacterized protein n=1 Tax=Streptomyces rishiriensis TaxID=68264 RepID=A0ABU0NGS1_STRRH|nr:lanthionine synthetase LanC family protein [Streptomyces rishiriensis]MDQ0578296.1 hypothetical protein [Streptomyces rishiriensis]